MGRKKKGRGRKEGKRKPFPGDGQRHRMLCMQEALVQFVEAWFTEYHWNQTMSTE